MIDSVLLKNKFLQSYDGTFGIEEREVRFGSGLRTLHSGFAALSGVLSRPASEAGSGYGGKQRAEAQPYSIHSRVSGTDGGLRAFFCGLLGSPIYSSIWFLGLPGLWVVFILLSGNYFSDRSAKGTWTRLTTVQAISALYFALGGMMLISLPLHPGWKCY
ncbi:hypothetical protein D6851_02455 [Altericroceibacterium spongiae]|uniref:Uncharacterized protein n=2 Tax=Altericroceibacterium spongiae TaxID=2320269 RepID=A0A420ERV2_9SPHN|nr:hypothetical protein D6851_02455 [Altericroceibacterium spongiae]